MCTSLNEKLLFYSLPVMINRKCHEYSSEHHEQTHICLEILHLVYTKVGKQMQSDY